MDELYDLTNTYDEEFKRLPDGLPSYEDKSGLLLSTSKLNQSAMFMSACVKIAIETANE